MPFATQCRGKLATLQRVKRFLEKEYLVGGRNHGIELVDFGAARTGNDNDVDVRIERPDAFRRLNAVDSRRHAYVQKYDRERLFVFHGLPDSIHGRFALVPGLDVKSGSAAFALVVTKYGLLEIRQCRRAELGIEVLSETADILVKQQGIVINDEYAIAGCFIQVSHANPVQCALTIVATSCASWMKDSGLLK